MPLEAWALGGIELDATILVTAMKVPISADDRL